MSGWVRKCIERHLRTKGEFITKYQGMWLSRAARVNFILLLKSYKRQNRLQKKPVPIWKHFIALSGWGKVKCCMWGSSLLLTVTPWRRCHVHYQFTGDSQRSWAILWRLPCLYISQNQTLNMGRGWLQRWLSPTRFTASLVERSTRSTGEQEISLRLLGLLLTSFASYQCSIEQGAYTLWPQFPL